MKLRIRSIKTKISIVVLLIILFFGFLATLTTYLLAKNTLEDTKKHDFLQSTLIRTHETRGILFQSVNLVKAVAKNKSVIAYMNDPEDISPNLKEHLINHSLLDDLNIGNMYSAIYLIDRDGKTLVSTDISFVGKNYGFRDYFKQAIQGETFVDVSIGVTSQELGYYFSHPIRNQDDEIVGVAVVKQRPNQIEQAISDEIPQDESIFLVDRFGVIVYSSNPDKSYKSLGSLSSSDLDSIEEKRRYAGKEILALNYAEVLDGLKNYQGPEVFIVNDEMDGEIELLSLARIGDFPFYIVGEVSLEKIENFVISTVRNISIFVSLAALTAGILISLMTNHILKPVSDLLSVTQDMISGNFNSRAEVRSEDELGDLAQNFNKMTDQLVKAKENVEQKVAERTADLDELNQAMVGRELKMVELKKEIKKLKEEMGEVKQSEN